MPANRHTFIVRVWQREDGSLIGQLSDPHGEWRHPFRSAADLWRLLAAEIVSVDPSDPNSIDGGDMDPPACDITTNQE